MMWGLPENPEWDRNEAAYPGYGGIMTTIAPFKEALGSDLMNSELLKLFFDANLAINEKNKRYAKPSIATSDPLTATIPNPNAGKQLPSGAFSGDPQQILAEIQAIPDPVERKAALDAYARSLGGHLPPAPVPKQPSLADLAAMMGVGTGGQRGGGMPSVDFSEAERFLKDAEAKAKGAKLNLPDYTPLVDRAKEFSSLAKQRPDLESDDYNPLQGKRLSDFMFNLGANLLAQKGMPLGNAIGESIKGAKGKAEEQAAGKYKMDTEKWRDMVADAKTMLELGQKDYENLSEREKTRYTEARQGIADAVSLGKGYLDIAKGKSENAYRQGALANQAAALEKGGIKDKIAQAMEVARLLEADGVPAKEAKRKGLDWAIGKQERPEKPQDMTKAMGLVDQMYPGLTKKPGGAEAMQVLTNHYSGANPLTPQQLEQYVNGLRTKGLIK